MYKPKEQIDGSGLGNRDLGAAKIKDLDPITRAAMAILNHSHGLDGIEEIRIHNQEVVGSLRVKRGIEYFLNGIGIR